MGRNRMRRAARALNQWLDGEALAVEVEQDDAAGRVGGAERTTFADLGTVPGASGMLAARQWQGRYDGSVGRASGNHNFGARAKRCLDLLGTGQRNDVA